MRTFRLAAIAAAIALALAGAVAVLVAAPAGAQQVFDVQGANPGSDKVDYQGEVAVVKTGDTWQVEWLVGGARIRGTGVIMDGTHMAVAGALEGKPFVFIMKKDGERFVGVWTSEGAAVFGREIWTPK